MKGFIEVTDDIKTHLLNVKHIEEVWKNKDGKCTIYFAFNIPDAVEQDHIHPRESYDEIKQRLEEATK